MVTERASCQFERGRGHDYTRRKRTVGESLTVAAMAIQHRERSCHAFVTNRAARTAALIRNFHCTLTHKSLPARPFPASPKQRQTQASWRSKDQKQPAQSAKSIS